MVGRLLGIVQAALDPFGIRSRVTVLPDQLPIVIGPDDEVLVQLPAHQHVLENIVAESLTWTRIYGLRRTAKSLGRNLPDEALG